jgi:phosphofructokinase-like protein
MRVGVLTGGGDCPGLNAVIRAVVRRGVTEYGYEFVGFRDGWKGPLEGLTMPLDIPTVRGILPRGGTILGSSRTNLVKIEGGIARTEENLRKLGIDALVAIGGEDTLGVATTLTEHGFHVIGVPKTIDNDLSATDYTFGFDTAVNIAMEAIDRLHTTAESHQRVIILEVMGRYAGWIALEAGMSGSADVILIPEIPYSFDKVTEKLVERKRAGSKSSIVVVAEGAKPAGGEMAVREKASDGYVLRLGGMGEIVASEITKRTGIDTRVTVLGHLQRGGSPCPFDRLLATRYGAYAIELIAQKKFGEMVSYQPPVITSVPLENAITHLKLVEPDGELVKVAEGMGVSFGR